MTPGSRGRCRIASLVLFAGSLWLIGLAVHSASLQVQTLTQPADAGARRFPFVLSGDALVARRINDRLFIDTFERMAPQQARVGLREVDADAWASMPTVDYGVLRNDSRILSLQIRAEGCGAYCEEFTVPHAFDAATGRHIEINDLITTHGRDAMVRMMQENNLRTMRRQIAALKSAKPLPGKAARDAGEDVEERIALLETCIAERGDASWRNIQGMGRMAIEAQALVFSQERCSNHAMRALDDLGEFSNRWPFAELRAWLTPYGSTLLLGLGAASTPDAPFGQVLRGVLGERLAVTVWLRRLEADGSTSGIYFYDRFRRPIQLSGRYRDGVLELSESASEGQWRLRREGTALRGTWTDGAKTLPLRVAP